MEQYITQNKPFPWRKKGLVFASPPPGFTHASQPCVIKYRDDIFILAHTMRDERQRSHIFLAYARAHDGQFTLISEPKMALAYGDPGYFDCDGVISGCFVRHNDTVYLYYVGWQNLPDSLWACNTGRAVLDPHALTLEKEFPGPVMGRDKTNPLFVAATAFHIQGDTWHAWYNSGDRWEKTNSGWKHYYGLSHGTSHDGVHWQYSAKMCIPFADEYEYAFGRPSVLVHNDRYYMWFAHRATKHIDTYRMGFASSLDGEHWQRNDAISGIDVSESGWDSEMICYPCVFEHKGRVYMLYNGNDYGKTGFGLAVLGEE